MKNGHLAKNHPHANYAFRCCCVYHRTLSRVRVERKALSLRSCIAQFDPCRAGHTPLRRSAFQNIFAFIISIASNAYIRSHFFQRFRKVFLPPPPPWSKQLCVYHLQNHPESRLDILILRQKSDDKRTLWYTWSFEQLLTPNWLYMHRVHNDLHIHVHVRASRTVKATLDNIFSHNGVWRHWRGYI